MVYTKVGGNLRPHVQTNAGAAAVDTAAALAAGTPYHVVSTWDSATGLLQLFLNGTLAASLTHRHTGQHEQPHLRRQG